MTRNWNAIIHDLGIVDEGEPSSIAEPIEASLSEVLEAARQNYREEADPLNVDSLIIDCIERLKSCLEIRERTWSVEIEAVRSALSLSETSKQIDIRRALLEPTHQLNISVLQNASELAFNGDSASFQTNAEAWNEIKNFTEKLTDVEENRLKIISAKTEQKGNAANYKERFAFLKQLFNASVETLYKRCLVVSEAMNQIYGVRNTIPSNDVGPGFLDRLALWLQELSDRYDTEIDDRQRGVLAVTLKKTGDDNELELLAAADFAAALTARRIVFNLDEGLFEAYGMVDPLLRDVQVIITGPDAPTRIWPVYVRLPAHSFVSGLRGIRTLASTSATISSSTSSNAKAVHNLVPVGEWEISLARRSTAGHPAEAAHIHNVTMILELSYKLATSRIRSGRSDNA